jgi:hypothetical protein
MSITEHFAIIILSYGRVVSDPEPRNFSVFILEVAITMQLVTSWWADFPEFIYDLP